MTVIAERQPVAATAAPGQSPPGRRPSIAYLSFSSGQFDARSMRMARSAVEAGWHVTVYARLDPGQPAVEERDGYRVIRVPADARRAVPLVGTLLRRRPPARGDADGDAADGDVTAEDDDEPGAAAEPTVAYRAAPAGAGSPRPRRGAVRRAADRLGPAGGFLDIVARWRRMLLSFPLRPLGWAAALEDVVEPADIWHGLWAGSLPALQRLRARHGGRTVYDSRDIFMLSRNWARLEWPLRPIVVRLERHWARRVDRVLTVNEPYAELLARQLGVPRPPVVMNCPERWTPPTPAPDLIRQALGIEPSTSVVLYQGQLITERGIEQSMDAILRVPNAILALLGYGPMEHEVRRLAVGPPYLGKVHLLPAVPPTELLDWTASADASVVAIQPTTLNHRYTTPQKLFESMAVGVPVVAADLPGMRRIVRSTGAGVLCDPTSAEAIAAGLREILGASTEARAETRRRILEAAWASYTWERQATTLFALYDDLLAMQDVPAGAAA